MSDKSKADSGDRWTEQTSSQALDHGGGEDGREIRSKCEDQQRQSDGSGSHADQHPPRTDQVDDLAGRNLADETRKSTGGQHKSDAFRTPSAIRKVDCHKGAEAGQKSREKKVQPIERLQACRRRPDVLCVARCQEHPTAPHTTPARAVSIVH